MLTNPKPNFNPNFNPNPRWSQTADFATLCNLAKQNFDAARKLRTTEVSE